MIECREIVDSIKTEECQTCKQLELEFQKNPGGLPPKNVGLILAAVTGGSAFLLSSLCLPFVTPALRRICLPYVPATTAQVGNVMQALRGRTGTLVDIGSGDGRIVLEAAKNGFKSHGVEMNLWLVLYSRFRALRLGLRGNASFARQDLWKTNYRKYDNIVIFGVEQMMPELEEKLQSEVTDESVVVACRFPFPKWKPTGEIGGGVDTVWRYDRSARKKS